MRNRLSRRGLLGLFCSAALAQTRRDSKILFEEIPASASGIRWTHDNAMSEAHHLPESLGPGCAFLDYDNDGWMDIYLVNSGPSDFFKPPRPLRNALYRNNRDGTFREVTAAAGVAGRGFGMGVAAADYDNDGYPDLFVTSYGTPVLYRNNRDGTFSDVTSKAGLDVPGWTTSAVWFDYDNDGLLDLFVCSFVEYSPEQRSPCVDAKGKAYYCIPRMFRPTASRLYRNKGDGTFALVSDASAIGHAMGKALGVVATDVNNDGLMDLFVANDTVQNFLFLNRGRGNWEEAALRAEVGLSMDGKARSGMGVDAADFNGDGWQDLLVANIDREVFSLYRNTGFGFFQDVAIGSELGKSTYLLSGWGSKFLDIDNDGALDLFLATGHPDDMVERREPKVKYREPLLVFHQESGRLRDVGREAGPVFQRAFASRGLAAGDIDNDGRLDLLVGVNGGPPLLLKNRAGEGNNWVGLKLRGVNCNRDGIGSRIAWSSGGTVRRRLKSAGGSYLSSHDPREVLGLGSSPAAEWVEVQWPAPSGRKERFEGLPVNRYTTVVEGEGKPVKGG